MKKPNLFIIGAPKCGTTAMAYYLKQHPKIFFSEIKEPHFFNTDSKHRYYFSEDEYLKLFDTKNENYSFFAEGSVWYLYSDVAVENILKFNPDAKFLIMLRNPVDMFFSLHQELLFGGTENIKSPLKAWGIQAERLKGLNIPIGCSDARFLQYGESCSLGKQVERIIKKINTKNVKFITLDELKKDTNAIYFEVLSFLGLEKIGLDEYKIINEKKIRKSLFLATILKYLNSLKHIIGIKKGFGIANKINKMNVKSGAKINSESDKKHLLPTLKKYFKNDIELLEKMTNKNLISWK